MAGTVACPSSGKNICPMAGQMGEMEARGVEWGWKQMKMYPTFERTSSKNNGRQKIEILGAEAIKMEGVGTRVY